MRDPGHDAAGYDAAAAPPPPPQAASILGRESGIKPIDWRAFLAIAAPLAILVALFDLAIPAAGLLLLFPASVFVAVHLYRRRRPMPLKASQGAKLGAMIGLLAFAIQMAYFVAGIVHDPAAYRHALQDGIHQFMANNPDPEAREKAEALLNNTGGILFLTVLAMPFALGIVLVIGGVSGAVAASLPRNRSGP